MPVIDHPVHEMTRQKNGAVYGCHNRRPFKSGYLAAGLFIQDNMSRECRYDRSLSDGKCNDCKWRGMGEKYDADQRRLAAEK